MKTREKCPKCGDVLECDPGLGIVCSNEDCPVIDEADLWIIEHTGAAPDNKRPLLTLF